jgi:hypothetical protein
VAVSMVPTFIYYFSEILIFPIMEIMEVENMAK